MWATGLSVTQRQRLTHNVDKVRSVFARRVSLESTRHE